MKFTSNSNKDANILSTGELESTYLSMASHAVAMEFFADMLLEETNLDLSGIDTELGIKINAYQKQMKSNATFFLNRIMQTLISMIANGANFAMLASSGLKEGQTLIHAVNDKGKSRTAATNILGALRDQAEAYEVAAKSLATQILNLQNSINSIRDKFSSSIRLAGRKLGKDSEKMLAEIEALNTEIQKNIDSIVQGNVEIGGAVTTLVVGILTTISTSKADMKDKKEDGSPPEDTSEDSNEAPSSSSSEDAPDGNDEAPPSDGEDTSPNVDFAVKAIQAGVTGAEKSRQAMENLTANNKTLAATYQSLAEENAMLAIAKAIEAQNDLFINEISQIAVDAQNLLQCWSLVSSQFDQATSAVSQLTDQTDAQTLAITFSTAKLMWSSLKSQVMLDKQSLINQNDLPGI